VNDVIDVIAGLVPTGLLAFFFEWGLRRIVSAAISRILVANVASLAVATVAGGYGYADDGPPLFMFALLKYALPQAIVLVAMLIMNRGRKRA
jgi:hypothetical protein